MRVLKWVLGILVGLFLLLLVAISVLAVFRFGGMPMMARGFRGPMMFGGYGFFGWAFLLGRLLIPLLFAALLILGGFAIGRSLTSTRAPAAQATCSNCGRPVQADWNNCPYCGANLRNNEPAVTPGENVS